MLIQTQSFARAGLVGNPSDGYFGKTISFTFSNYSAKVTMYETPEIGFEASAVDDAKFESPQALLNEIQLFGYYGGIRLLKAITKIFLLYFREQGVELPQRNFTVRYTSDIPRLVGLSGSSAICTAMLKALQLFYEVEIPGEISATLCLRAEREELGIECGLQDRVIQTYQGLVFMDFDRELVESRGYGIYTRLDPALLPNIYVAFDPARAEVSGVYHQKLRVLFEEKAPDIVSAMTEFADLAQQANDALTFGQVEKLPSLINYNFDLRDKIFSVSEVNHAMVMDARRTGCSAKFAGSGGAIVGTYDDEKQFRRLTDAMKALGCQIIKPVIV
ncbi:MAG: GHMP kinase [Kiritimatiellia bacterium]